MRAETHPQEAERLSALRAYGVLDTAREAEFDEIAALAARICEAPIALVTFLTEDRQWFKAAVGTDLDATPRDASFCAHAILQKELLEVEDASVDSRFVDNPLVTGELGVRFYAGVALETSDGLPLGSLCILDTHARRLTDLQRETLRVLARQVMAQLDLRRKVHEMAAQSALRTESQTRTRTLFDALEEGFCVIEMIFDAQERPVDYRFREFNPAFSRFTGITPEDALGGKTVRELYPTLEERWFATYGRVATTGESVRFENRAEAMGKWFDVHAFRIGGEGSVEVGVLFKDVSERKAQETARAEERARQDRTLENAEVATFDWDAPNDRVFANPLLAQFFDVPKADAQGAPIARFFAAIHPDDVARVQSDIGASLASGGRYETEYRVAGDRERSVLARGDTTLDSDGKPVRLSGVVLDITARVEAEQALRERDRRLREAYDLLEGITEGTQELIVSIDCDYRFTSLNEAYRREFVRVFGVEPRLGESLLDALVHLPQDRANAKAMWGQALAGESVDFTAEFGDPGLARRTFDLRFYPVRDPSGEIVGAAEIARDVTDRERLVAELAAEREKLDALFRMSPSAIAVIRGDDLRFEFANDAYLNIVGRESLVGKPLLEALPEIQGQGFDALLREVMATGQPFYAAETPVLLQPEADRPSRTIYVDLLCQAMREADGTVSGAFVHAVDVTDGVQGRQALMEREELFRTVFEQAPDDAILVMDLDRTITAWNPAAERICGWTAIEAIGRSGDLIFTPEDRAKTAPEREAEGANRAGKSVDERWHLRKDGSRFWGSGTMNALHDEDGAVRGYLKVFRDTTERYVEAQTLAFLSLLTEAVIDEREPDHILGTVERMLGQYLDVSRVTFGEFAEDEETFVVRQEWGPGVASVLGTYGLSTFGADAAETLRAGRTYVVRDAAQEIGEGLLLGAGQGIDALSTVSVPVTKEGRLVAVFVVHDRAARDWTDDEIGLIQQVADRLSAEIERSRAEQALREAKATLEETVEKRTEELKRTVQEAESFNYSISHDLRSPLRAMVATASILLEEAGPDLGEEHREMLVRQAENAKRLGRLIDELLRLSRLARVPVNREALDMSGKARRVFDELASAGETNGCRLDVQEGMAAQGDAGLVRTVLQNLIGNACKFSPNGGTVRVTETDGVFSVTDEGVGFDMQFAPKVFLPFERLVAESEFPGTGIGLANVKRIVERHGGRVGVESVPGAGTTFWFTLEDGRV